MKTIDISHLQGTVNFGLLDANSPPIDAVIIKASEGSTFTDPMYVANINAAIKEGVVTGAYHFARPGSDNIVQDATAEANFFLSVVAKAPAPKLPLILDIEVNKAHLSKNDILLWITTFFGVLKAAGHEDYVLYSFPGFLNDYLPAGHGLGTVKLWLSHFTSKPQPIIPVGWKEYWLWQYSDKGVVNGVKTPVDVSKSNSPLY